ncbi:3-oxoacyl-ACP synthase III [Candidatus Riflebacteria bacterium]
MRFENVCIEAWGYELPPNIITTEAVENSLASAYQVLNISKGRLEMLSGIKERRWWDSGFVPSDGAVLAARKALSVFTELGHTQDDIGILVNTSVCRDYLEPSTASAVHGKLGLPQNSDLFDISNACLGFASGIVTVANRIELGQIKAGIVVSCECGRELVENTIREIVANPDKEHFMDSIASLTIGSGAVCVILTNKSISRVGHRLLAVASTNNSSLHTLCQWKPDTSFPSALHHSMKTDGKMILEKGIELGVATWQLFENDTGWNNNTPDRYFCHQVGVIHRNMFFKTLGLDVSKDFTTIGYLGNTGSVAMPITFAIGVDQGQLLSGQKAAMLGIGSGLCCTMLGLEW